MEGPKYPVEVLSDIETQLSLPLFRGVPIGPTLSGICSIELLDGHGDWSLLARCKNIARQVKYFLLPGGGRGSARRSRKIASW